MRSYLSGRRINITLIFMSSSSYLVHAISCSNNSPKISPFVMFIIIFLFLVSPFNFYYFYFLQPDPPPATRYPSPATRHPPPVYPLAATRHPSPVTRHPRKSTAESRLSHASLFAVKGAQIRRQTSQLSFTIDKRIRKNQKQQNIQRFFNAAASADLSNI